MEVGVVQRVTAEKPNLLALRDMVERRIGAFQDTHYPCNPRGGLSGSDSGRVNLEDEVKE